MKILYFHQHFTTPKGSGGTRSYEFAKGLVSKGHSVTLVCGTYEGGNTGLKDKFENNIRSGYLEGINIVELNIPYSNKDSFVNRTFKFIHYSLRSLSIVLRTDFDILFSTSTPLTAAVPVIFSKLINKGKFVFEVRDLWPELPKAMGVIRNPFLLTLLSILESLAYKSSDGLIGLSPGIVNGIKKKTGRTKKIMMIPNGSDINLFDNSSETLSMEVSTGIDKSDFVALYAGTHGQANGLDSLVLAAKELKERKKNNIKIVLIGDGSEKQRLIRYKNKNNIDNLLFLPSLPKVKLGVWMKRSDLGLQILDNIPEFYYGTSPNKFFDYLSSGLPVLVNYPGWLAEIIEREEIGYFADPAEQSSLANKLIEASKSKNSQYFSGNSLKVAKNLFNRKNLFIGFNNFLEEIHDARS